MNDKVDAVRHVLEKYDSYSDEALPTTELKLLLDTLRTRVNTL